MLYAVETADSSYLQLEQVGERCGARRVCVCVGGGGGGGGFRFLFCSQHCSLKDPTSPPPFLGTLSSEH